MVIQTTAGRKPQLSANVAAKARKPRRVKMAFPNPMNEVTIAPRRSPGGDVVRQLGQAQAWHKFLENVPDRSPESCRQIQQARALVEQSRSDFLSGTDLNRPVQVWGRSETRKTLTQIQTLLERAGQLLEQVDSMQACPRHLAALHAAIERALDVQEILEQVDREIAEALAGEAVQA